MLSLKRAVAINVYVVCFEFLIEKKKMQQQEKSLKFSSRKKK